MLTTTRQSPCPLGPPSASRANVPAVGGSEPVISAGDRQEPLHLRRRDPVTAGAQLIADGWWPRSLDLAAEIRPLPSELYRAGYDPNRVVYNLPGWEAPPPKLTVSGRRVKLGGSNTQASSAIRLLNTTGSQRIDLVAIPPQPDRGTAERALAVAGLNGDRERAGEILDHASRSAPAGRTAPDPVS